MTELEPIDVEAMPDLVVMRAMEIISARSPISSRSCVRKGSAFR